jgi:hypothetical protein
MSKWQSGGGRKESAAQVVRAFFRARGMRVSLENQSVAPTLEQLFVVKSLS